MSGLGQRKNEAGINWFRMEREQDRIDFNKVRKLADKRYKKKKNKFNSYMTGMQANNKNRKKLFSAIKILNYKKKTATRNKDMTK